MNNAVKQLFSTITEEEKQQAQLIFMQLRDDTRLEQDRALLTILVYLPVMPIPMALVSPAKAENLLNMECMEQFSERGWAVTLVGFYAAYLLIQHYGAEVVATWNWEG